MAGDLPLLGSEGLAHHLGQRISGGPLSATLLLPSDAADLVQKRLLRQGRAGTPWRRCLGGQLRRCARSRGRPVRGTCSVGPLDGVPSPGVGLRRCGASGSVRHDASGVDRRHCFEDAGKGCTTVGLFGRPGPFGGCGWRHPLVEPLRGRGRRPWSDRGRRRRTPRSRRLLGLRRRA